MKKKSRPSVEIIDAVLPQTQCGLCSYGACRPYAQAIVENNEQINRCPPGGVPTLLKLASLLQQDSTPYLDEVAKKTKSPRRAVIREAECIGCTKCIQACPVDAIVGTAKMMHTVIEQDCTGCELCIEPCPVDCIEMVLLETHSPTQSNHWRTLYEARQNRMAISPQEQVVKCSDEETMLHRKNAIQEALARAKSKKMPIK